MENYKKDIIMVYHLPVDGLTKMRAEKQLYEMNKQFTTGDFYREYFFPKKDSGGKIDIEIINLKGNKTEHVSLKIDELEDKLMKYFEKDKWIRKQKLRKIMNYEKL